SAALALQEASQATHDLADWQAALAAYEAFDRAYPQQPLAEDSLLHRAVMWEEDRDQPQPAAELYRQVLARFPGTPLAALAQAQLNQLEPRLAKVEPPAAPIRAAHVKAGLAKPAPDTGALTAADVSAPEEAGDAPARARTVASTGDMDTAEADSAAPGAGGPAADAPAQLKRMQVLSALQFTRIILTTSRPVHYRGSLRKGAPAVLLLQLKDAAPAQDFALPQDAGQGILRQVRLRLRPRHSLALALGVQGLQRYSLRSFELPTESKLVLDLYPAQPTPAQRALAQAKAREQAAGDAQRISLKTSLGLKVKAIMLDAGHGGRDPGASAYGQEEKTLALRIARFLRDDIHRAHPDIRVGMTRDSDEFIPLARRPQLAKAFGADLFVSIHLNANPIQRFHGVETYFLNLTSDASALQVAARENATSEKKVGDLNLILLDLLRDTNILESSKLAQAVQTSLVGGLRQEDAVRDLGVKQAPFMVLIGAEMPSVLVEVGFITNREECQKLKDPAYLEQIAAGINRGLDQYISGEEIVQDTTRRAAPLLSQNAH
ncbi:MAG TPA: N-acetylmuramoyl-L-alanine amidase, partial [bacterium]|nr:N-acetylmuramoyl-L-alanine amidase [bacterium]